jgi:hypothetical protein
MKIEIILSCLLIITTLIAVLFHIRKEIKKNH